MWPVSARLSVESVMGAPPGTDSTAGSRDCTTTMSSAAKATAIGSPTTCGTLGALGAAASIVPHVDGNVTDCGGTVGSAETPPEVPPEPVPTPVVPSGKG